MCTARYVDGRSSYTGLFVLADVEKYWLGRSTTVARGEAKCGGLMLLSSSSRERGWCGESRSKRTSYS